jgi:hypothetical protein
MRSAIPKMRNVVLFFTLISWSVMGVRSCSADCQESLMTNVMQADVREASDYRYGQWSCAVPLVRWGTAVRGRREQTEDGGLLQPCFAWICCRAL